MQNNAVNMTKQQYFEMCEMMGTEPIDSQIPIEFEDFPVEIQQAFNVYRMLRDDWDYMGGNYIGKSFIGITEIMDALEVELVDRKYCITLIRIIDDIRQKEIAKKQEPTK